MLFLLYSPTASLQITEISYPSGVGGGEEEVIFKVDEILRSCQVFFYLLYLVIGFSNYLLNIERIPCSFIQIPSVWRGVPFCKLNAVFIIKTRVHCGVITICLS